MFNNIYPLIHSQRKKNKKSTTTKNQKKIHSGTTKNRIKRTRKKRTIPERIYMNAGASKDSTGSSYDTASDRSYASADYRRNSSDRGAYPGSYRAHIDDRNNLDFDIRVYDNDGYDIDGYDRYNHHRDSPGPLYDVDGYDINGYDIDGLDADGFDANGFDYNGLDIYGNPVYIPANLFDSPVNNELDANVFHDDNVELHDMDEFNLLHDINEVDNDDYLMGTPIVTPSPSPVHQLASNSYSDGAILPGTPSLNADDDQGMTIAEKNAAFFLDNNKCPVGTRNNGHNVCVGTRVKRCAPGQLRVNGNCTPRPGINRNRCLIGSRKRDRVGPGKYLRCLNVTRQACKPGSTWNAARMECVDTLGYPIVRCDVGQTRVGTQCIGTPRKRCRDGTRMNKRLNLCRRKAGQNNSDDLLV